MLSEQECVFWDKKGLFLLPSDTPESYLKRVQKYQKFSESQEGEQAFEKIQALYNIEPVWVPVVYSDKDLHFWEAACSWMQKDEATDSFKIWIQLKKCFQTKKKLYFLYQKSEVLAHEYVHACRYMLNAEKYEEFFAYYTSFFFAKKSPSAYLRAIFGPLFSTPKETQYFLLALVIPCSALAFDSFFFELLLGIPFLASSFFVTRLLVRWRRWYLCKKKIPLPLMVRLTDDEIELFHTLSQEKVRSWIEEKRKTSFRWQQLSLAYCN